MRRIGLILLVVMLLFSAVALAEQPAPASGLLNMWERLQPFKAQVIAAKPHSNPVPTRTPWVECFTTPCNPPPAGRIPKGA